MKIAICSPVDIHQLARHEGRDTAGVVPGLGSTAVSPLVIELLSRGHHLTIYTLSNGLQEELFYEWGNLRIFVGPSRSYGPARDFYHRETAYLTKVIREDAQAFVHAHWTYEFSLGALGSGVPTITTIHDLPWNVLKHFRDRSRAVRLLMAYVVATKGKHFSAVSPDAANHFRRWLRPGTSIPVIPNFLQDSIFENAAIVTVPDHRPFTFITLLQGWSRRKNASCALKAFKLTRMSLPDARLIMVGTDYEEGGPAHTWALSEGLSAGVIFQGAMQHDAMLRFVSQQADVLVHPSLDEAFSVASLEAMALRKPVIGGIRTPGLRWVFDSGRVGLLVEVRNPAEVAGAMLRLATDDELRERLSNAAFDKAWNHFRAEVVVTQYEAMYQSFSARQELDGRQWSQAGGRA